MEGIFQKKKKQSVLEQEEKKWYNSQFSNACT